MSKSRFRIIAIRPITPIGKDDDLIAKVKSIQKKVFGKGWLYFYDGYHLEDINKQEDELSNQPLYGHRLTVPCDVDNAGMIFDTENISVNISAVVGPNGSGKSSVIDLMIRILNNLSVAAYGETYNHTSSEHLFFIENVYGSLVAVEGNHYFQIQVSGRSVKIASYKLDEGDYCYVCDQMQELLDSEGRNDTSKPIKGSGLGKLKMYNLFYTAIFNYSMYAFNYKDYYDERTIENRWISQESGALKELFKENYNEDQNWLKGLFHKNDGYQTPIVLNPMRDNGIINVPKENKLAAERLHNMLFYSNESLKGHGNQPLFPFRIINEHLEVVAIKVNPKDDLYFSSGRLFETLNFKGNSLTRQFGVVRQFMCECWSRLFCMRYSEVTEHEKLAWDYVIYKTLKIVKTYDKYNKYEDDLLYFKQFNPDRVERLLQDMLKDETHITLKLRQSLCFLKYKVFREDYREIIPLYDAYEKYSYLMMLFKSMNISMNQETHRLTMVSPKGYKNGDLPELVYDSTKRQGKLKFSTDIERPIPLFYVSEGVLYIKTPDIKEIMIPPIFDITLMVIEKSKIKKNGKYSSKDLIPMYGLSSGERQISGVISNFAYHLANIDSVWKDERTTSIVSLNRDSSKGSETDKVDIVKYKYINAVFDEVELYFHPDLQRRFVNHLINTLRNLKLQHIQGINIMLVTHSPFVLSDLPRTCILTLGDNKEEMKETFCANIHDMLGNSFFMKYTVGEVAKAQVEEILKLYNDFVNTKNKKELLSERYSSWHRYQYVASLIADDYLHGLVGRMLEEMESFLPERIQSDEELDRLIVETEARLQTLKEKKRKSND